jgi:hypothetical protein
LDLYLRQESDTIAFLELIAESINLIRNAGYEHGIPVSFYEKFPQAQFAPPFADGTNWRAVAWPFMQVAAIPLTFIGRDKAWPLLKQLGW